MLAPPPGNDLARGLLSLLGRGVGEEKDPSPAMEHPGPPPGAQGGEALPLGGRWLCATLFFLGCGIMGVPASEKELGCYPFPVLWNSLYKVGIA